MLEGRLGKKRGHFTVDIRIRCEKGELLALTGPSGIGKTTVIRMLAGLEMPDRGRIVNDGIIWYDGKKNIVIPVRRRKVGYVFQEHSLFPHLNVADNVGFSCPDRRQVDELLEIMGITHLAGRKPHRISGGERQRAALAQALASDPHVLLLDEPFSALDERTRFRLRRELKALKDRLDIPVILVTHDRQEAEFLADTIINMACSDALAAGHDQAEERVFPALIGKSCPCQGV